MLRVYLEAGAKKTFACACDWPGWARAGRTEEAAVAALVDYTARYAPVAAAAGLELPAVDVVDVVERVAGNATTDFGAPGAVPRIDGDPVDAASAQRFADLVGAAWGVLDEVLAGAPAELRKGPRGGGRDRDKIAEHVLGAEQAYARKIGVKVRQPAIGDREAITMMREQILEVLRRPGDGGLLVEKGWPQRYAVRRIAWHALDHAWEIEDRS